MVTGMRRVCFCFSPRTATVVLGCVCIILAVLSMVPNILILQNHSFYIGEFVKHQRRTGAQDIPDDEIPSIAYFSKLVWSLGIAFDVIATFASILLITGVVADKRYLLLPWLVTLSVSMLFFLVLFLAAMMHFADKVAFFIFMVSAPCFGAALYFWFTVYATFHQMHKDSSPNLACVATVPGCGHGHAHGHAHHRRHHVHDELEEMPAPRSRRRATSPTDPSSSVVLMEQPSTTTTATTASAATSGYSTEAILSVGADAGAGERAADGTLRPAAEVVAQSGSLSSLASVKLSLRRVCGATPPPPYEAVARDIDKEEKEVLVRIVDSASNSRSSSLSSSSGVGEEPVTAEVGSAGCGGHVPRRASGGPSSGSGSGSGHKDSAATSPEGSLGEETEYLPASLVASNSTRGRRGREQKGEPTGQGQEEEEDKEEENAMTRRPSTTRTAQDVQLAAPQHRSTANSEVAANDLANLAAWGTGRNATEQM